MAKTKLHILHLQIIQLQILYLILNKHSFGLRPKR